MKNYIPQYFNTKQNVLLLLWVTAVFGEMFILFFQPVQCRTWVDGDWKFLLWVTIVVVTAVSVIALSRTFMYHYAKRHKISYLDYAIWIIAEVTTIAWVYSAFPLIAMRSFSAKMNLTLFYLFKESLFATAFTLLIPYAFVILWMVVKSRGEQIVRLQARQTHVVEDVPEEMYNFYAHFLPICYERRPADSGCEGRPARRSFRRERRGDALYIRPRRRKICLLEQKIEKYFHFR